MNRVYLFVTPCINQTDAANLGNRDLVIIRKYTLLHSMYFVLCGHAGANLFIFKSRPVINLIDRDWEVIRK